MSGQEETSNLVRLTPRQVVEVVPSLVETGHAVLMLGPPGCGKTDLARQVFRATDRSSLELHLAYRGPQDLHGLPYKAHDQLSDGSERDVMGWLPPRELPVEGRVGILLDEITNAAPLVQIGAYQLALERQVGALKLGSDVRLLLAGNRPEDLVGQATISSALLDRCYVIEVVPDPDSLLAYAIDEGWHGDVTGFLRWRPDLTYRAPAPFRPGVTPRGWEMLGGQGKRGKPAGSLQGVPVEKLQDVGPMLVGMKMGRDTGADFGQYLALRKEAPPISEVLERPDSAKVPESPGVIWSLFGGLMMSATEDNYSNIVRYWMRADEALLAAWIVESTKVYGWAKQHKALGEIGRDRPELARAILGY